MGITIVSFFAPDGTEQPAETDGEMMKSEEAYSSEIWLDLHADGKSQDMNADDVDQASIEAITNRIWETIIKEQGVYIFNPNHGDPEMHIDNWIKANPDSIEARTLLWLES